MNTFFLTYTENYLKLSLQYLNGQRIHSSIKWFLKYLVLEHNFKVVKHNHFIFFYNSEYKHIKYTIHFILTN